MIVPSVSMALVEHLPISVVLVTTDLRVLHTNLHAGCFLTAQQVLVLRGGRLTAGDPQDAAHLRRMVQNACAGTPAGRTVVTALGGPPPGERVVLKIIAVEDRWLAVPDDPAERVVAIMIETGRIDAAGARGLAETFELSPAELDILKRLAQGLTPKQIAHARSTELWTVRTHIRNMKAKLGCRTDNELIILFDRFARM
jgi:DNA-binding CsgD family transcriptional regulator